MKSRGCSTCAALTLTSTPVRTELTHLFILPYWRPYECAVFFAYAVVTEDKATLFIEDEQLDESTRQQLGETIDFKPYDSFFEYLKVLPGTLALDKEAVSRRRCLLNPPCPTHTQKILIGERSSLAIAEAIGQVSLIQIDKLPIFDRRQGQLHHYPLTHR
jgi:hypothetical protein